jgi:hypothetical protein
MATPIPTPIQRSGLLSRQTFLIEQNVASLRQAVAALEQIDDSTYRSSPPALAPHRVGGHIRHVLEFYECFLDGVELSHIDYDARKRDESVETSREVALARIRETIHRLEQLEKTRELRGDLIIWVRVEDAGHGRLDDVYMTSSVGRELQTLSSHTIHHFALIAVTLKALGHAIDRDFGTAPSTLRYRAARKAAAEAA